MNHKNVLFIGFGDIATRASQLFLDAGDAVTGVARTDRRVPDGVNYWRGDAKSSDILQKLAGSRFDVAVITLTPDGRRESDYQQAYLETSQRLVGFWNSRPPPPGLVIYVSSTSVYGQSDGEWVDEDSATLPTSPRGRCLLHTESVWRDSGLNTCIVRFAGIYGPGRTRLLQQVAAGNGGPRDDRLYTNRIHVDDCAGSLYHLAQRFGRGELLQPVYLGADGRPAPSWEVRSWLAEQLGFPPGHLRNTPARSDAGSKRCDNRRLLDSGYPFLYPDYRAGFTPLIETFFDEA